VGTHTKDQNYDTCSEAEAGSYVPREGMITGMERVGKREWGCSGFVLSGKIEDKL
jgi:hypothetical protein